MFLGAKQRIFKGEEMSGFQFFGGFVLGMELEKLEEAMNSYILTCVVWTIIVYVDSDAPLKFSLVYSQ